MVIGMGMGWTKAQQKVIDTRNKNILVSAAAGSGKTAVLVERIISMISEGDHPFDIDHLLVVTFTNAAAAEMRGRIGKAIDEKLLKEPDNVHLQKQISLLQSAQITTIHSFCLNVIRNYFHRIDLDPSFKIADESEITLMKSDVISEVLESWYEEGREDFHAFIESYSYSKSDAPVEDLILGLYQFAMSAPWPKSWISEKQRSFELQTMEDLMKSDWMQELLSHVRIVLGDLLKLNEAAIQICNGPGGPSAYLPALISDRELLKELIDANSYQEYANAFRDISYTRLSNKREEGVDPQQKEQVKALRDLVKKGIKDLSNQFFFQPPEEMLADMKAVQKVMQVLFELTLDFMEAFADKKEEKNLIDFNDLEHF
ncbi:MAG: UvrD-helicase domain-containing protein, partial [Clostridiales bacterium]|nr:UvrD-helicase domain-containing protein [Clostridiales bacterium]